MMALLVFPLCAILWMLVNARLGLVEDQPPMTEAPVSPQIGGETRGLDAVSERI